MICTRTKKRQLELAQKVTSQDVTQSAICAVLGYIELTMKLYATVRSIVWSGIVLCTLATCLGQDATASRNAIEVPETEMAKRLTNVVAPELPKGALRECSNALVMLKVTIDESGSVVNEEFVSGFSEFKDSSIAAVKQWTYKPYEKHGHAVAVQTRVSIFYLGDGESFPMYSPDGKGGVKGGSTLPLPPGCGPGIVVKRTP